MLIILIINIPLSFSLFISIMFILLILLMFLLLLILEGVYYNPN